MRKPPLGAASLSYGCELYAGDVVVNDRAEHAQVWVENSDHTLSFRPCELLCH